MKAQATMGVYPSRLLGKPCVICGIAGTEENPLHRNQGGDRKGGRHAGCFGVHVKPGAEIALDVPFAADPKAQRFVGEHPWGASRDEIAAVVGVSRELVRRVEAQALRRLRDAFPGLAVDLAESLEREAEAAE